MSLLYIKRENIIRRFIKHQTGPECPVRHLVSDDPIKSLGKGNHSIVSIYVEPVPRTPRVRIVIYCILFTKFSLLFSKGWRMNEMGCCNSCDGSIAETDRGFFK